MVNGVGGAGGGGKIGGVPPGGGPSAPSIDRVAGGERKSFGESVGAAHEAGEAAPASPLERLRAGQIDLPQYVELQVREATAHLDGVVAPADLEAIRAELRDVMAADPDVAALARAAQIGS